MNIQRQYKYGFEYIYIYRRKADLRFYIGSDLHCYRGHESGKDYVMGHEVLGEIIEVGKDVKKFKRGDIVISPFSLSCGKSNFINIGLSSLILIITNNNVSFIFLSLVNLSFKWEPLSGIKHIHHFTFTRIPLRAFFLGEGGVRGCAYFKFDIK